ncbi:MAG: IclR family transcriptional regulator [Burkholderiaceae bacterium]
MGEEPRSPVVGTKSAGRILSLLRLVGAHGETGVRLRDLTLLSGLDRSTTHRLLACLVEEGFVERMGSTKLYRLGLEALQWGFASNSLTAVAARFRPMMQRLSRQTEDTVFLFVRSGDFALCLHREEGSHAIKAFVTDRGAHRPLGISAVGIAMLAKMSDDEVHQVYARTVREYERLGVSLTQLEQLIGRARKTGFSEATHFRGEGARGVGGAFHLTRHCMAGVSIAATNARMPPQRMAELGEQLGGELAAFSWQPYG